MRALALVTLAGLAACSADIGGAGDVSGDLPRDLGPDAGSPTPPGSDAAPSTEPVLLTQSTGTTAADANVNCRYSSGNHSDTFHYRVFSTDALPAGGVVSQAILPIEVATSPNGVQSAFIRIHRLSGSLSRANLQMLGEAELSITDQSLGEETVDLNIPFTAGDTLVVEVETPDSNDERNLRFGYNKEPQTGPTYMSSTGCGIPEPTDLATLENPDQPGTTFAANSWLVTLVTEPN